MYTATMNYPVMKEAMEDFVGIWDDKVLKLAVKQPGFVRMLLVTREEEAMAMGVWEKKEDAENFMALGPFKALMDSVTGLLTGEPKPIIWSLAAFAGKS